MLFSICIAVYNAKDYLRTSVASVLSQSCQDFEIILVDDFSKDGSYDLCEQLANEYQDKIRVIHNSENLGLLLTRRVFFQHAKGEWFVAVDADDLLLPDALETLKTAIETNDCDLILYDLDCLHRNGMIEKFTVSLENNHIYSGKEKRTVYEQIYESSYINSICTKAIHRSLIDYSSDYSLFRGLRFGTDIFQSYPIFDAAQNILYLKRSFYSYIKRDNGITTKWHKDWYEIRKMLWNRDHEYRERWSLGESIERKACTGYIRSSVAYLDLQLSHKDDYSSMKNYYEKFANDGILGYCIQYASPLKFRHMLYAKLLKNRYFYCLYLIQVLGAFALRFHNK